MHKEIREIVKQVEANGFTVEHGGKHLKVKNDRGSTVATLPTTPGGGRLEAEPTRRSQATWGAVMAEYVISLETKAGLGNSDMIDWIADQTGIYEDEILMSPALSISESGALGATFAIQAESFEDAFLLGWSRISRYVLAGRETGEMPRPDEYLVSLTVEVEDDPVRQHAIA